MTVVADLHLHTTQSDGRADPEQVISVAKQRNLDYIALTDHDTYHNFRDPIVERNGLQIISGIELRVEPEELNERVDVLAYGIQQNKRLDKLLEDVRSNRKKRGQEIVDRIEEKTGVRIDFESTRSTGRPDIARAVDSNSKLDYTYKECFQELIGRDNYCYVSRDVPSFDEGVDILNEASYYTSLAHPYRYNNSHKAIKLAQNLDAVECYYNYGETVIQDGFAKDFTDDNSIGRTGGSDAHILDDIGSCGLDEEQFKHFAQNSNLENYI